MALPEVERQVKEAMPRAVAEARNLWFKMQRFCGRSIGPEDLEQVATWALFRAAARWRDWYGKALWTFARRAVRTAVLRCIRTAQRGARLPYHLTDDEQVDLPRQEERIDARRAWDECLLTDESMAEMAERLGYGETTKRYWSVTELAVELGVSNRQVTKLLEAGAIEGSKARRKLGGYAWRIPDHAAVDVIGSRRKN